jgi:hypothetical protein
MRRTFARTLVLVAAALALVACGDDSDSGQSDEQAFCEAGDQLETDVAALSEVDVVAEGTNAVDEALNTLRADTEALVVSGQEFAADDINELERAVDGLGVALDDLDGELTAANGAAVLDAFSVIGTAADNLQTTLTETCG